MSISRDVAHYCVEAQPNDLPPAVRHEAVRALVNWIGLPIWGTRDETVVRMLAALDPLSGPREAALLGRAERIDPLKAALINSAASSVPDYDDTHLATVIHPTGPAAAALLALVERTSVTGADFLHALALGIEVQCRLALALVAPPARANMAWYLTGVTGGVGAAVGAGRLLRLDEDQMLWAIGIAAARASGSRETHGSMAKNLVTGCAAEEGLFAALLAGRGVMAPEAPLEGARGLGRLVAEGADFSRMVTGLGSDFELLRNAYKPFPCGIVIHAAITGALAVAREAPDPAAIEAVRLTLHPMCLELCGRREPKNAIEGTFSVYHWVAVAVRDRAIGIRHYSDAVVRDPAVIALRDRVTAAIDAQYGKDEAEIEVTLRDGRTLKHHVDHALGAIERPPSDAELERKLLDLVADRLPQAQARQLADACWHLPSARDARILAALACPRA
jgi:2-methylcitrate dehydratase PrpD